MAKQLILVVDDTPDNIDVLGGILRPEYEVKAALNGTKALKTANTDPKPDMILLDIMMPGMDGYEVCLRLKENPATSHIPVIFITAKDDVADEQRGFELGAVDYVTKPVSPPLVKARIRTHLALYDQSRELRRQVRQRTEELNHTRLKIIQRLGLAAEFKDNETGLHVIRMSHYVRLIGEVYGGNAEWVEMLFNAAPMHDIGKIGIPDSILMKPGKLDPDEWEIMKRHAEYGAHIIGDDPNTLLQMARTIALTHHEKWDGSGYPNALAGEAIALEGRIVAIADVFDALTSERPYKRAWSVDKALQLIEDSAGSHFDPVLAPMFVSKRSAIEVVKERYADETAPSARFRT